MNDFLQNITPYQSIGALFAIAFTAHLTLSFILNSIAKHTSKTKNQLDDHLIKAVSPPLKVLIWFGLVFLSISVFKDQIKILASVIAYIDTMPIFIITWGAVRMISGVEAYLIEKDTQIDNDSVRLFSRLARILIIIAIALGVAQYLGFSISGLLTFGGVGGIVMGFAAKDMLSNIFGGLMIQMDKPFSTGDWIRSDKFEGTVEKIGWRMTRIRTFSKNPVYIPNSIFATIPIETPSRMTNRRIKEVIGIRYDDIEQLPVIMSEIEQMLKKHADIDHSQSLRVYFNHFNASSLDFNVYAFTNTINKTTYQKVKEKILLSIAQIITKHNAEIAYPTQTLYIQK
ncbi:small-conductance mechanosensitive channel [Abyssogena phaseoliformis symbiont OG214]|uniref:mechanosensitive ion channel family protein n=1 Tax=Abyssogena phaseoliformis symbiont TaxID=596095 RepID=UPI001916356B|nr:mechanosensitive ion channel family protein [Abyssogena phaseoliformis symbiont]MBW5289015.1 Small-conductance mechanosensitive channel [Candidatus Ruthia sp. Apha_13_S6]BBB22873.1 small-conductance mechanosensitive channel [Abyssogena phaseoliformis symbiont OG214]